MLLYFSDVDVFQMKAFVVAGDKKCAVMPRREETEISLVQSLVSTIHLT